MGELPSQVSSPPVAPYATVKTPGTSTSPAKQPNSYAAAVKGDSFKDSAKIELTSIPIVDVPLPLRQYQTKDGCPAVYFTPLELQRAEVIFQYTLIAKFSRGRPTMDVIRSHIAKAWGLKQQAVVGLLDPRHVLIKLANASDFALAWTRDNHKIEGAMFRMFKWSWDFRLGKEPPVAPVWIGMPDLSIGYCIPSYLKALFAPMGRVLAIDLPTLTHTRPSYARVCVEMDLTKPRPRGVWIGLNSENAYFQTIEFENLPKYCGHCQLQGHEVSNCRRVQNRRDEVEKGANLMRSEKNLQQWIPVCRDNEEKGKEIAQNLTPSPVSLADEGIRNVGGNTFLKGESSNKVLQSQINTSVVQNLGEKVDKVDVTPKFQGHVPAGREEVSSKQESVGVQPEINLAKAISPVPNVSENGGITTIGALAPEQINEKNQSKELQNSFVEGQISNSNLEIEVTNPWNFVSKSKYRSSLKVDTRPMALVLNNPFENIERRDTETRSINETEDEDKEEPATKSKSSRKRKKKKKAQISNNPVQDMNAYAEPYIPSYLTNIDQQFVPSNNTLGGLMKDLHLDSSYPVYEEDDGDTSDLNVHSDMDTIACEKKLKGKYKGNSSFGMTLRGNRVRVKF